MNFPLSPLSKEMRKKDLLEALSFGNHKGVTKHKKIFEKLIKKDIIHGYALPIPLNKVTEIENALMAPLNIAEQNTISELGEIVPSQRLTHNQSKEFSASGTSVNSRVQKEALQDCLYGHCLLRMIHYILALRSKYPNKRILLQKIDYKSAYRRLHFFWETAIQSITQFEELALISLRETFGGSPGPNVWGCVSEPTTDLANVIVNDPNWDPEELHSPLQDELPEDKFLPDDVPFAQALPMVVNIPIERHDKADVYIDDKTIITVDVGSNRKQARAALLLAIHVVGRPLMQMIQFPVLILYLKEN